MPKKKLIRRFEPRYGVSQAALEAEANYLAREVEDYAVLSASELESKQSERHKDCQHSWQHLQLLLEHIPERDQKVIQSLLFRDFYHLLLLYLQHIRTKHPETETPRPSPTSRKAAASNAFTEWLFDPK